MKIKLSTAEVRVLGCLIEKELTTPEYYPLTLNALRNACNQKSNREPVVDYDGKTVARSLESLREKGLAVRSTGGGSRVPKYKHHFGSKFGFNPQEVAVMCILMLRGPQTPGEIRGRTGRMFTFENLDAVEATLDGLISQPEEPFVVKLERQPGRKESRYAHLFSGELEIKNVETTALLEPATQEILDENERITKLEDELKTLRIEFDELKQQFLEFKNQFE